MPYATAADLEPHVGHELSVAEADRATAILELVSTAVDAYVRVPIDPDAIPSAVRAVTLSASIRRFLNPGGVTQEAVGSYSASHPGAGELLTAHELRVLDTVRRAARYGSVRTPADLDG